MIELKLKNIYSTSNATITKNQSPDCCGRLQTTFFVDGTNLISSTTNKHEFTRIKKLRGKKCFGFNRCCRQRKQNKFCFHKFQSQPKFTLRCQRKFNKRWKIFIFLQFGKSVNRM